MRKNFLAWAVFIFVIACTVSGLGQTGQPISPKDGVPSGDIKKPTDSRTNFQTPEQLANFLVEAIRDNNLNEFKTAIPKPEQLKGWFDTISNDTPKIVSQKKWLLERSEELLSGEAEKMFGKIRKSVESSKADFSQVGSISAKVSQKYFYDEADVLIPLQNGAELKFKDCIKTPTGWVFLSEVKLKKTQ